MNVFTFRLQPEEDLKAGIEAFIQTQQIQAGFILTAVGSLKQATLRFANQDQPTCLTGTFEIVSLVGTLSVQGSHLHLSVADSTGNAIGGHLIQGCIVYTTAEIVIGEIPNLTFMREFDPATRYRELVISD